MSEQAAKSFIDALGRLEYERDLEAVVRLFTPDCEVGNVVSPEKGALGRQLTGRASA